MSRKKGSTGKNSKVTLEGEKKKSTALDFRYPPNWASISEDIRKKCIFCCWCLVKPSKLTHHVEYVRFLSENEFELLLDRVIAGENVFPVCDGCHRVIHSKKYYETSPKGRQFDRNNKAAIERLKIGYQIIVRN
jgi:hypothetical protein